VVDVIASNFLVQLDKPVILPPFLGSTDKRFLQIGYKRVIQTPLKNKKTKFFIPKQVKLPGAARRGGHFATLFGSNG